MMISTAASILVAITLSALVALPAAHAQPSDRGSIGRGMARGPVVASPPPRQMISPAADQFRVDRRPSGQQWTPGQQGMPAQQWTPGPQWTRPAHLPAPQPPFRHPGFDPGRPGHRPFYRGPYAPGAILYGYPVYYPVADASYAPQPAYDPSLAYAPPGDSVPPAPGPTVLEFPNGRYELRGDGVAAPYMWVWIPNAPPPPPAPPTVTAPPAPAPAAAGTTAPRQSRLYRWVDAEGVAHWTDREDAVPAEYRAQANRRL